MRIIEMIWIDEPDIGHRLFLFPPVPPHSTIRSTTFPYPPSPSLSPPPPRWLYDAFEHFEFNAPQRIRNHNMAVNPKRTHLTTPPYITIFDSIPSMSYVYVFVWDILVLYIDAFDRLMHFVYHYEILMNFSENWWINLCSAAKLIPTFSVHPKMPRYRNHWLFGREQCSTNKCRASHSCCDSSLASARILSARRKLPYYLLCIIL